MTQLKDSAAVETTNLATQPKVARNSRKKVQHKQDDDKVSPIAVDEQSAKQLPDNQAMPMVSKAVDDGVTALKSPSVLPKQSLIFVTNHNARDMLEPHTGTYLPVGQRVEICLLRFHRKKQVLDNLAQLNYLNGNRLMVELVDD